MYTKLLVLYLRINPPKRAKFKTWTELEGLKKKINEAVDRDITKFPIFVNKYLSTALKVPIWFFDLLPWEFTLTLYISSVVLNFPAKIPIFTSREKEKEEEVSWDYEGRNWHYWSHLLAKTYGWTLQYISKLDVDDAMAHIMEILTTEQLEREFVYSLSELAYSYNSTTQSSKFVPLPRPYWMKEKAKEIKLFKMPKELIPVGLVNDDGGMYEALQGKNSKSQ